MHSTAFTIANLYGDLGEATGMLTLEADQLVIEFQTRDAILGLLKSDIKEVVLDLNDLVEVTLEEKLFRTRLHLKARRMGMLGEIPGVERGELCLQIARKDRAAAGALSDAAQLRIAELRLKRLDEDDARA